MHSPARGTMTRRRFLGKTLALGGGVALLGARPGWGDASQSRERARWAFISDTHVPADIEDNYRGFYPHRNLQKVVGQIAGDRPDGTVITGDLARLEGLVGDYENARQLLAPIMKERPVCVALGNHDNRDNFISVFDNPGGKRLPVNGKHVVAVDVGPARFLVMDSLLFVNKTPGLLGKAQRLWLAEHLRSSDDKPTILFFHHPLEDSDGDLLDAPRLLEIVGPMSKVKAIVYGHSHVYGITEQQGIAMINLPATGYNFNDAQPIGWVDAVITGQGCELTLRAVGGNTGISGKTEKLRWRS